MNITYRVIWNNAIKEFVVASENARGKTKSCRGGKKRLSTSAITLALSLSAAPALAANGIIANSGDNITVDGQTIKVANGAAVTANDGAITGNNLNIIVTDGIGVVSTGSNANINLSNSVVTTSGTNKYGAFANAGAKLTSNNVEYNTNQRGSAGIYATGPGTEVTINGGTVNANGISNGLTILSGAKMTVTGTTFNATSRGLNNQAATLVANNVRVNADNGLGVVSSGVNANTIISDSVINTTGDKNYGLLVTAGGSANSMDTNYTTAGKSAARVFVTDAGSYLSLKGGTINTTQNSNGISATNGAAIDVDGTKINATAHGIYASQSTINVKNADIIINPDNGFRYGVAADFSRGLINISDSRILSTGKQSYAINGLEGGTINAKNVSVMLQGGGSGFSAALGGKNNIDGALLTSNDGGRAFKIETGSTINASNVNVMMDNNNSNNDNIGIASDTAYLNAGKNIVNLSESNITVSGANATGISSFANSNESEVNLYDSSITAVNGDAIRALTSKSMTVNAVHSAISGSNLIKSGYKTDNSTVENIMVNATNQSILTGNVDIDRSQTLNSALNLSDGTVWTGASSGLQTLQLSGNSQWNVTGNSDADTITLDNSTLSFAGQEFSKLTTGSLNSNNGSLLFKTALADDNSPTDTLHITGDYTGNTNVSVTNAGGTGAQTLNGIPLIEVDGAVNGSFVQKGRIVAGAYDYNLVQAGKKWLLESDINNTVNPGNGGAVGAGAAGGESPAPAVPIVRSEAASYAANLAAANTLFSNALSQRPAESEYTDLSGERHKTSLWVRNIGGQTRFNDRSGQVSTRSNRYALQLGGDLGQWQFSDTDRLRVGTMVGYGNVQSKSHSRITGYSSRAKLNGYSAGVYASWTQNEAQQSGVYVDSSMLYNWFKNSVTGEGVSAESYKSRGITASLESGYNVNVAALNENYNIWLSPQAQLSVMDVRMHNLQEHNGTQVRGADKANVQTRLGTRAYLKAAKPDGMSTSISPYVEASWIHRSHDFNARLNGVRVEQAGARNVAEIKAGVDASLNKNVSLWGNISQQLGSDNYRDTSAVAGIKVSF